MLQSARAVPRSMIQRSEMTGNALIVGYGNPLRGDDGVGQAVARAFANEAAIDGVEALACHQLTPELAERFAAAARVVLIDAVAGRRSGRRLRRPAATRAGAVVAPRSPCRSAGVVAHGAEALRPIARGLPGYGGGEFVGAGRGAVGAGHGGAARGHRDGAPIGAEAPAERVTSFWRTRRRAQARFRSSRSDSSDQPIPPDRKTLRRAAALQLRCRSTTAPAAFIS